MRARTLRTGGLAVALTLLGWATHTARAAGAGIAAHRGQSMLDVAGHPLVPARHPRIVSLAPSLTEILYAIGAGGDLVADSDYCDYPAAARKLPHVGSLETLRVERIVALHPNLVVTATGPRDEWLSVERLASAPVFVAEDGTVAAILHNIDTLGSLCGHEAEATALARRISAHVAAVRARARNGPHPRVFYLVWGDPLQTAGPGTYLGELIADAGGRNVAPADRGLYPRMAWETLLLDRPDIVIGTGDLAAAVRFTAHKVGARKAVTLDQDILSRPGPRVMQALDLLYRSLH